MVLCRKAFVYLKRYGGSVKWGSNCGKTVWQFLKKLNIELPYEPAIPLLGKDPQELRAGTQTDICTPVSIAALLTIAQRWKKTQISVNR